MSRRIRRKVESLVEKHYWEGFFAYLGDGLSTCLEYREAPRWYTEVAKLAHEAGYAYARDTVSKIGTRRFGTSIDRTIPARLMADCYAAARMP